jgi:hypothetical protein
MTVDFLVNFCKMAGSGTQQGTQKREMVAGVGFEPTTSGPVKPGRMEECQPGVSGLRKTAGNAEERGMVAGVGFEPTTSGL